MQRIFSRGSVGAVSGDEARVSENGGEAMKDLCEEATKAAEEAAEEAVKEAGPTGEGVKAHVSAAGEAMKAFKAFEHDFPVELTDDEEMRLERLRQEARWSEAEELHLERLRATTKEHELEHQLQQTKEKLKRLSLRTQRVSQAAPPAAPPTAASPAAPAASSGAAAPITPIPAAGTPLSGRLHLEARDRRASQGDVEPRHDRHAAAPSGSRGVVTLADLSQSAEEEARCAICGEVGVPGTNELLRCGFGDGPCIQEEGEAPRRACWHAGCQKELRNWHGRHVVCARHEKDARFKLNVGPSGQACFF